MEAPPLPKKKPAVFHHPTYGMDLYDGLAMDLHAMTYAEPMLKEIERLRAEVAHWQSETQAWIKTCNRATEARGEMHAENKRLHKLIEDHNADCVCNRERCGYAGYSRKCPDCPDHWRIEIEPPNAGNEGR